MALQNNSPETAIRDSLRDRIITFKPENFDDLALDVFRYQAAFNPVYSQFIGALNVDPNKITRLTDIPFLPIQFFKTHTIRTGNVAVTADTIFESSGTTGLNTSRHHLYDPELYKLVSERIFQLNYGDLNRFHILALLPSYLERNNSSLVYMVQHFIARSGSEHSGFYLNNPQELLEKLKFLSQNPDGKSVLLLGVTFALLDLADSGENMSFLQNLDKLIVMDTGGMKGRRREMLREEVHDILTQELHVPVIHSEYGMTELISQGYSHGNGLFEPGNTLRILIRDVNDPLTISDHNPDKTKTGGINVIDLANLDSCAFIETQDLGRFGDAPGTFYVMGRFDNSDIRGCNLMVL
ncbi:LuxE/PaaK family acyltransferase [Dyadobacter luticola]|uniref:Acyl transferase n=1 Tax=Dyadobacter luticola TaxID=1979387 RepID=A0A5R9KT17_9BACT|nr:acyl transferase [Dyadobacter luticola]TLU99411.1 acyl transferase [Dyadobacter luticola]